MNYGVTGPRELTPRQTVMVERVVLALKDCGELVSGAAEGVDSCCAYAAEEASSLRIPFIRLTIPRIQPSSKERVRILPCNQDLVRHANRAALHYRSKPLRWVVEMAEPGRTVSEGYLKRDDLTVARSQILLAFPKTPVEEQRSGTWATVRRARKAGIEIRFYPLDFSEVWTEPARERLFGA